MLRQHTKLLQAYCRQSSRSIPVLSHFSTSPVAPSASAATRQFTYFDNFEVKDGVALIRLNGPNKMNTLSEGMTSDVLRILNDYVKPNKDIKAIVFLSSKPDNFIAGADIDMIRGTAGDNRKLKEITMNGHKLFDEIKKLNLPLVAAINGACLGGGLEWALYCDYRIATSSNKTVVGFPEVKLGLLPGMAGTYHLPKLSGYATALDMILTGKNVRPDKAKKLGIVDLVVDPASLESVAIMQAKGLVAGTVKKFQRKKDIMSRLLEDTPMGRHFMFKKAKETVDKNSGGHYPAPYKILEVLENNYGKPKSVHFNDESDKFVELAGTKVSEALIGIFHGTTAVKKHNYGKAVPVNNVGVLGAGLMGAGIAQVSVDNGKYRVLMKDKDAKGVARGEKVIKDALEAKLKKKSMTNYQVCETTSRLVPLHDGSESWKRHFGQADLVIEAVFEELSVKHAVLKQMEDILPSHAIFASNTSAIPITKIAEGAKRPDRVIGMHYFSPVPMMPLLEIINHAGTAPEVSAAAMEVGSRQGKTPIFVKDVPGFFVNRCLSPQSIEVMALVLEGVELETLDKAMKDFGMPVGPITLSDEVGIDIAHHVATFMSKADLGVRMNGGDPEIMSTMLAKGFLGRKSGKGFYLYPKDAKKGAKKQLNPEVVSFLKDYLEKKGVKKSDISKEDIQWRIISRFINEAAYCLQDGIIRSPVDGDIGAVFGIGFPPFLGGPFRLLDQQGVQPFIDRMYRYRDLKGPQFEPAQILKDYAASGKKFYPK